MFLYYLLRILKIGVLLGAGGFCLYKMFTVKPHRLKKEGIYSVYFRDDLPDDIQGKELARFNANKGNLAGTVIFSLLIVVVIVAAVYLRAISYTFFLIPLTLVLLHTLDEGTKSVGIYKSGIVIRSILRKKFYPYKELDCLKSYNVLNSFHKGISYGYCFLGKGEQIISMDIRQYPTIAQIETIFAAMPGILKHWTLSDD